MFDDDDLLPELGNDDRAFEMLQELERNRPEDIRRQRAHFRITIKTRVVVQPGDASRLLKFKVQGVTGDLSEGGCSALLPVPMRVGDVYRLQFDREALDLPLTFARCLRCRLLREESFEAGFQFFSPVTLPGSLRARRPQGAGA